MPVSEKEVDRVDIVEDANGRRVHVKSYGLPLVFWCYLAAILTMILIMGIAVKDPLTSVLQGEDQLNRLLGYAVLGVLFFIPFVLLALFFYEKTLAKRANELQIIHKIFWCPIWKTTLQLKHPQAFTLEHYLDSPNMARLQNRDDMKGFVNKGYFELFAILPDDRLVRIDRCSQKNELKNLKEFLSQF